MTVTPAHRFASTCCPGETRSTHRKVDYSRWYAANFGVSVREVVAETDDDQAGRLAEIDHWPIRKRLSAWWHVALCVRGSV